MFRPFLALFLTLVLLPWGAFASPMPVPSVSVPSISVPDLGTPESSGPDAAPAVEAAGTGVMMVKVCRGPALPGTPCNPVFGLLPGDVRIAVPDADAPARSRAGTWARGHISPPLLAPPRVC